MHPCPGNLVAIGHAVVYYARAAHAFSAGIKTIGTVLYQIKWLIGSDTELRGDRCRVRVLLGAQYWAILSLYKCAPYSEAAYSRFATERPL